MGEKGRGRPTAQNSRGVKSIQPRKVVGVRSSGSQGPASTNSQVPSTVAEKNALSNKTHKTQILASDVGATVREGTPRKTGRPILKAKKRQVGIVGKVIDNKFKVIREISTGGMGVVYEAEHLDLKKRFAIKSILSEYTQNPNFNKRFDREAKTQALLQHPNIIQVTDFIKEDGLFYMVMEYIQGQPLDELLRENKVDEERMLAIVMDVLKGLGHAHSKGIIHRDIKPSNIMITQHGTAKLMDFGIALLTGQGRNVRRGVMGTPSYMSPEQIDRPKDMDHRSDIYSLGIVMFEILCGKRPFDGKTVGETKKNHIHQKLPKIKPLFPECATEIIHIVRKTLEKRPEDRFNDTNELLERVEAYDRQTHIECHKCKTINRVKNKYQLKGEKCENCGRTLSKKSKFTKIWATAFGVTAIAVLTYLLYPWPGSLIIKTKPANAQVWINGEQKGFSPITMSLAPGGYEVVVKKEHLAVTRKVIIRKHQKAALEIDIYKKVELQNIAYDAIRKAYQSASYVCRDLNDLIISRKNLKIANSISDSALIESYQQQITELEQNIEDGFIKYAESFRELEAIKPEIRNTAHAKYITSLKDKGGNLDNFAVVWRHFGQYLGKGIQKKNWKAEIMKFC